MSRRLHEPYFFSSSVPVKSIFWNTFSLLTFILHALLIQPFILLQFGGLKQIGSFGLSSSSWFKPRLGEQHIQTQMYHGKSLCPDRSQKPTKSEGVDKDDLKIYKSVY